MTVMLLIGLAMAQGEAANETIFLNITEPIDAPEAEEDKDKVLDCIDHLWTDILAVDLTVEEHKIRNSTMLDNVRDSHNYTYVYDLYFINPGVKCRLNGTHLKVYVHDHMSGLEMYGNISKYESMITRDDDVNP
jgi:hypothetical protein